jgi:hypothetical protein
LTEDGKLKHLDGESQEDLAEAEKYVDYRLRKHEQEESEEELQLDAVNKPLRPLYPSDTSPRIEKLKLYNKINPVEYIRAILGDVHFPPWLYSPIVSQESDGSMKLLEDNLQTDFVNNNNNNTRVTWKPLDLLHGSKTYSLYVTMVNRIDYIERLIRKLRSSNGADPSNEFHSRDPRSSCASLVGALRTLQDQYQLLSLHMELKNQYSNCELTESYGNEYGNEARYHFNYGVSPIQMYPPLIETSVFDLEELPDLFILVLYCEYWGDKLELPFKDAELIKLVDLLSKALPYPCKGRSVTSILPNSWSGGSVDNSIVYRVMSRLIMCSFLGCYPHCQVKAGFAVRRKLYKRFYLTPPQPEELSSWISKNKFLVIYIMREFLFYSIQAMPAVHKFMKDVYYWTDITTNTFQAMDEVRQRTNTAVEQFGGYMASPILEFDGEPTWESYLSQIYYNTDIHLTVAEDGSDVTFEEDIYQRSLELDDQTPTQAQQQPVRSLISSAIPQSNVNRSKQGRITKKRVKITSDPLVSVEETTKYDVSYQDDNSWYSHMNDVLSKYNSTNLDHCHRPIDMNFLDKLVFQMNKIIDENYSGVEPVKKRKRKSKMSMSGVQKKKKGTTAPLSSLLEYEDNYNKDRHVDDTIKMYIDEIVRRYDPEKHKAVPHELLLMPPISITETTNKKLVHAELLYTMETSRSEIEKALDDIYTECRFDFDVLYYFVIALAKRKSIAWYEAPKHFYNRQVAIHKQLVGIPRDKTDNDNLLPEHGGSYLICPNCCKIKTAVHPYDPVSHKAKNNSLCSAGVCIDMITGEFTCAKISSKNNPKKRNTTSNIVSELLGKKLANAAMVDDTAVAEEDQDQPEQSYIDYLGDTTKEVTEETVDILSAVAAADVISTGDEIKEAKKASKLKRKTDLYSACNNARLEQITMFGGILNINKSVVIMCPECATITTLSRSNYRMGSGSVFSCGCFKIDYKPDIVCRICKKNVNEPVYRTVFDDLPDMKIPKVRTVPLCRDHRNDWLLHNDRYISLSSIYQKLVGGYYVVKLSDGDSVFVNNDWGPSSRFARRMKEAELQQGNNNNNYNQ